MAKHVYESFEEWMNEVEVYSVRRERFDDDVYSASPELMIEWVKAAWKLGHASALAGHATSEDKNER